MGVIGKDFKFKKVKNFLTKSETNILKDYTIMKHRTNITSFDDSSNVLDTKFYGDPVMESVLLNKQKLMEKETGMKLLPTYAFWRMYTYLAELKKHKDRPACEISTTIMLGSDGDCEWPIFMEGVRVDLKPGDAVIYLGCELKHWRETFKGDWQSQVFMHYVNKNGKYADWHKDKRPAFGIGKPK
tara:strand:+ start:1177 stop:1731 length:555 start_codon:yes stop_codon:yes gene_type:complete